MLKPETGNSVVTGTLEHWRRIFSPVGWFIPPYIPMGLLSEACQLIQQKGAMVTQDDLENILASFYPGHFLAAMVANFYPRAPAITEYKAIIGEAVEAHFFGLNRVAVGGLIPVVEGAGRQLAISHGITPGSDTGKVLKALASHCKQDSIQRNIGHQGEIISMMDGFTDFVRNHLYIDSKRYSLSDKTNRHGIAHGHYTDSDYGRPLNFYKIITAINFLTFIASFHAHMSFLGPSYTDGSAKLAGYYVELENLRAARVLVP